MKDKVCISAKVPKERWHPRLLTPRAHMHRKTHLWSSGISGLFLNSDEVLMHGFSCLPLPVLSKYFFGGNNLCALPLNVLGVSLSLVFLAEREDISSFLRFVGGASLDTWCFLLVVSACCVVSKRKDQEEVH